MQMNLILAKAGIREKEKGKVEKGTQLSFYVPLFFLHGKVTLFRKLYFVLPDRTPILLSGI